VDVKQSFPAVDYASKTGTLIFDIGGNKYRLIALANFAEHELYVQDVLTHEQYNRGDL
jgi:mRNA interferase HigB